MPMLNPDKKFIDRIKAELAYNKAKIKELQERNREINVMIEKDNSDDKTYIMIDNDSVFSDKIISRHRSLDLANKAMIRRCKKDKSKYFIADKNIFKWLADGEKIVISLNYSIFKKGDLVDRKPYRDVYYKAINGGLKTDDSNVLKPRI